METKTQEFYKIAATSTGGRDGSVRSEDGILDLQLTLPPGLGGPGGKANPEMLFASGYAACYHQAIKAVAGKHKASIGNSTVTVTVALNKDPADDGFALAADIAVSLPNVADKALAQTIVDEAHAMCPYSKAIHGNVPVTLHAN